MMDPRAELDATASRRYPWIQGTPVCLNNGQVWLIAAVPLEFRQGGSPPTAVGHFSPDVLYVSERLSDLLANPQRNVTTAEQLALMYHALRINYEVTPEEASGLFDVRKHWIPVFAAVLGLGGPTPAPASPPPGPAVPPARTGAPGGKEMRNAECGMRNEECGMRNAECGVQTANPEPPPPAAPAGERTARDYVAK